MSKWFPETHELYVRCPKTKADSRWRSLFIGVYYPVMSLPLNIIRLGIKPIAFGVTAGLIGILATIFTAFSMLYLGARGRIDSLINVSEKEGFDYKMASQVAKEEESLDTRTRLDQLLEEGGFLGSDKNK
jgi:hypothetical protein